MSPAGTQVPSLEQSLAQLHADLAGASRVDEHTREMLRTLLADIERVLEEGESTAGAAQMPRLEGLAVEFEAEHPSLAASLRQFIDLLGKTGL
jgi:hypothetical protein